MTLKSLSIVAYRVTVVCLLATLTAGVWMLVQRLEQPVRITNAQRSIRGEEQPEPLTVRVTNTVDTRARTHPYP